MNPNGAWEDYDNLFSDDDCNEVEELSVNWNGPPFGYADQSNLKPCPFCGGKAKMTFDADSCDENGEDAMRWRAQCGSVDDVPEGCGCVGPESGDPFEAAKEWNKRI